MKLKKKMIYEVIQLQNLHLIDAALANGVFQYDLSFKELENKTARML